MTQLQLVEIDTNPGACALPDKRTIKAVSSSWTTLKSYCKETFGKEAGVTPKEVFHVRYEIESSDIVMVQENISKFDK